MAKTVADKVPELLAVAGIRKLYGIIGNRLMTKGFTLHVPKAVIAGRGDQVIDVAPSF